MRACSSPAAAATSFHKLLSSSSATARASNLLCGALETQTGVLRFIGVGDGDPSSSRRNLSPLVCVPRNLVVSSVASSFTQSSQIELEHIIEGRPRLSDEGNFDNVRTVSVKIQLHKECQFGEQFFVVGNQPELGFWNPLDAVPMTWYDDDLWTAELDIPLGKLIKFKFILREISGEFLWQPGEDRVLHTWETSNIISVFEGWEDAEAQQVTEERVVSNDYEETSHTATSGDDIPYSGLIASEDVLEKKEGPLLVQGLNRCSTTPNEDVTVQEEQVKVDPDTNIAIDIEAKKPEELVKGHSELEEVNGRLTFYDEHAPLVDEHRNEVAPKNDEDVNSNPDQGLEAAFSESRSNKDIDPWREDIKWPGQEALKRFFNNLGFP